MMYKDKEIILKNFMNHMQTEVSKTIIRVSDDFEAAFHETTRHEFVLNIPVSGIAACIKVAIAISGAIFEVFEDNKQREMLLEFLESAEESFSTHVHKLKEKYSDNGGANE